MKFKTLIVTALSIALICSFAACTGADNKSDVISIGSKDFTESLVVAEIYALALEDAGFTVDRKLNIAGSLVHAAIINKQIDMYPEYTGTGLLAILKHDLVTDPDEVYNIVKEEYAKEFDIVWLDSTNANDGQGLVISTKVTDELGIRTISDLQAQAHNIRFASQGEFDYREDGLPGMIEVYGQFDWKSSRVYDNGLKYHLLESGEADLAPAYTTEGQLVRTELFTLLEDDKQMWPPYYLTPIIRNDTLTANSGIAEVLNKVSATLDTETVIALNAKIDVDKMEFEEVAKEYFDSIQHLLE